MKSEAKNGENLITLKEASKISGYAPDYIGQLIRSGKIPGKQVFTNITWMTTAEAVLGYKTGKENGLSDDSTSTTITERILRKIKLETDLLVLFFKTFKSIIPALIIVVISFFIFVLFFLSFLKEGNRFTDPPKTLGTEKSGLSF